MDHRAALTLKRRSPVARPIVDGRDPSGATDEAVLTPVAPPRAPGSIGCAQAIFTSVRTPMGEGYRLVSATADVTAAEKAEIVSRAPSHGGLLCGAAEGVGLLAFPLSTGRYCVGASCYAGQEYSGRGGLRVWTRFALLDAEQLSTFGGNAVRVHGALAFSGEAPVAKPPLVLENLNLPTWTSNFTTPANGVLGDGDRFVGLMRMVLEGGDWTLVGPPPPLERLMWLLDLLPVPMRSACSLTVGLTASLGRRSRLTFVGADRVAAERVLGGADMGWCDVDVEERATPSPFDDWLTFVRFRLNEHRVASVARFADRLTGPADAEALGRLARLAGSVDTAHEADEEEKAHLRELYASFSPGGELEEDLHRRLLEAAQPTAEPDESLG